MRGAICRSAPAAAPEGNSSYDFVAYSIIFLFFFFRPVRFDNGGDWVGMFWPAYIAISWTTQWRKWKKMFSIKGQRPLLLLGSLDDNGKRVTNRTRRHFACNRTAGEAQRTGNSGFLAPACQRKVSSLYKKEIILIIYTKTIASLHNKLSVPTFCCIPIYFIDILTTKKLL